MKVGARVEFVADWSSFFGRLATVTQTAPHVMVVTDDDPRPIRVSEREVREVSLDAEGA